MLAFLGRMNQTKTLNKLNTYCRPICLSKGIDRDAIHRVITELVAKATLSIGVIDRTIEYFELSADHLNLSSIRSSGTSYLYSKGRDGRIKLRSRSFDTDHFEADSINPTFREGYGGANRVRVPRC
ncbi:MAG: hypothetical protein FJ267_09360 [Planctomycetes bacterium]|nr:hypothetical protein [Planctomycetota bacterium]